jgi:hypothetical protein
MKPNRIPPVLLPYTEAFLFRFGRNGELVVLISNTSANHSQQCVVTHRHHESIGKSCGRPAAERQTKVMDDRLETLRAAAIASQHSLIELFAKNASAAQNCIAPKTTRHDPQQSAERTGPRS